MRKKRVLSKADILAYLELLNAKLAEQGLIGEISICGGAAMALVYDARDSTYDIDAIYKPKDVLTDIIAEIAKEHELSGQWLNDDVSMFTKEFETLTSSEYLILSNLTVNAIDPEYLLVMKLLAAREDSQDLHDASTLIKHMGITSEAELFLLIDTHLGRYHPSTLLVSKEFARAAMRHIR